MTDEVVRTITIRGKADGLDQLTDQLKKVAEAQGAVPVIADKSARSLSSVEQAYQKQTLRLDENARMQDLAARQTKIADAALAQGLVTQAEHATRLDLINNKYGQATLSSKAFSAATSGVSGQLIALSAGAGPVGVFLSALGPWGIAAAVGLGAVTAAFGAAIESANKLAAGSIEMRRFSDETGLATIQLKALTTAAAQHGIQSEEVVGALTKFTVAWAEMRDGAGKLLTDIRKIDPALADQMQITKDSATAFNLLAQAIGKADAAGDISARNQLLRAAGGRGGVSALAGISAAVNDAGGIQGLADKYNQTHVGLDSGMINDVIKLKTELDETTKYADKLFASIGAKSVLEAELAWAKMRATAAEFAVELKKAEESKGFFQWLFDRWALMSEAGGGYFHELNDIVAKSGPGYKAGDGNPDGAYVLPKEKVSDQKTLKAQAEDLKAVVTMLGSAATVEERRQLKLAELNATIDQNKNLEGQRGRAIAAINLDADTTRITARVGALGLMAGANDVATQAQLRLTKANIDGAGVSPNQIKLLVEESQIKLAITKQNVDASFGLVSATDMLKLKTEEFMNTAKQRNYTDQQTAAGLEVVTRNAKLAYEATQVAASAHPQLTQLGFDLGNFDKQIDTVATGSLNSMTDSLVNITNGTDTAAKSFQNFGLSVVTAIERMIIQMTIAKPIADALQASIKGAGGGFNILSLFGGGASEGGNYAANASGTASVGSTGKVVGGLRSGGMVGIDGTPTFVHSAYFDNAPHMRNGGMITDDGIPIVAHPGERVLNRAETAAYNGNSGGSQVQVNIVNNASGTKTETKERQEGGVSIHDVIISTVNEHLSNGGADAAMRGRYGVAMRGRSR